MKKAAILFLCYALIFAPFAASAAIGVKGQGGSLPAVHPVNFTGIGPLDHTTPVPLGKDILQFRAGGHILGFKPDKVYLVSTAGFLSVEFMGTKGVMPKVTSAGKAQGKGLQSLGRVEYQDLWEGVTLSYEGAAGGIAESAYRIRPGADAGDIRLKYSAEAELRKDGSLRIKLPTDRGWMTESKPVAWQEIEGKRRPVEVAFRLDKGQVGFKVGEYDRTRDLIIDPTYQWHTFYGSSNYNYGNGIAVDGSGNVYVTGYSFATWNGPVSLGSPAPKNPYSGNYDIFVLKLDSSGAYQWHTFYGSSSGYDAGYGIAVDGSGNVYVTGESGASWNGPSGQSPLNAYSGAGDIVVLKLSSSGEYQWHTFYGSSSYGEGDGLAVDGSGNVYVTGESGASWNGPSGQSPLNAYSGSGDIVVLKMSDPTQATSVPTMNEWGMIIFMALAGLGAVYYLRKQKRI